MSSYYALNKDKVKARNDMNKEQRRAYNREYYLKNKAKIDEKNRINKLKRIEKEDIKPVKEVKVKPVKEVKVKPVINETKRKYNLEYYANNREILTIKRNVKAILNKIIKQVELGVDIIDDDLFYDCD